MDNRTSNRGLFRACKKGQLDMLGNIIASRPAPFDQKTSTQALNTAMYAKNIEALSRLLNSPKIDSSKWIAQFNSLMFFANIQEVAGLHTLLHSHPKTAEQYTASYTSLKPQYDFEKALERDNEQEIARLLKVHPGIDASYGENAPVKTAAEKGYTNLVYLLIQRQEVDPSNGENYAIKHAAKNGHIETVWALLKCDKLKLTSNDATCLMSFSLEKQHYAICTLLYSHFKSNNITYHCDRMTRYNTFLRHYIPYEASVTKQSPFISVDEYFQSLDLRKTIYKSTLHLLHKNASINLELWHPILPTEVNRLILCFYWGEILYPKALELEVNIVGRQIKKLPSTELPGDKYNSSYHLHFSNETKRVLLSILNNNTPDQVAARRDICIT